MVGLEQVMLAASSFMGNMFHFAQNMFILLSFELYAKYESKHFAKGVLL